MPPTTSTPSTVPTTGPDFVSFQVRDLEASTAFYADVIGLPQIPAPNPDAAVFSTGPDGTAFAVRRSFPGVDLDTAVPSPGFGIGVWFHSPDTHAVHERAVAAGAKVVQEPFDGPFGTQFAFLDPDGYSVTVHGGVQ